MDRDTMKIILGVLCLGLAPLAHSAEMSREQAMRICHANQKVAEASMLARQGGLTLDKALNFPGADEFSRNMVRDAFEWPVRTTAEEKIDAVTDFGLKEFRRCYLAAPSYKRE